jgi:predicted small metal-binding protein
MREIVCRNLGYDCGWKHTAKTEERLTHVVALHLRDVHNVPALTPDMVSSIRHSFSNGEEVPSSSKDDEPALKEFRCSDLGMNCGFRYIAQTEELIVDGVALHARESHGITEFTSELKVKVENSLRPWKG